MSQVQEYHCFVVGAEILRVYYPRASRVSRHSRCRSFCLFFLHLTIVILWFLFTMVTQASFDRAKDTIVRQILTAWIFRALLCMLFYMYQHVHAYFPRASHVQCQWRFFLWWLVFLLNTLSSNNRASTLVSRKKGNHAFFVCIFCVARLDIWTCLPLLHTTCPTMHLACCDCLAFYLPCLRMAVRLGWQHTEMSSTTTWTWRPC